MEVNSRNFGTKECLHHFCFNKKTIEEICRKVFSIACFVAFFATPYFAYLAICASAKTFGLFTTVSIIVIILAVPPINTTIITFFMFSTYAIYCWLKGQCSLCT
ncbi:MAG: hypothetical protein K1000chlam3_00004 [Chlamydiae bacterium]|nr:hypothetical protein [Chlamydiota bacterium]